MVTRTQALQAALLALPVLTGAGVAACAKEAPVDPGGCLAAVLAHEEHTDDDDGVSHDVRYEERLVRCGDHVWTARVLPRGLPERHAASGHREMPPSFALARLVTRQADGRGALALVATDAKQIIDVSPESFDAERFDGDFEAARHLISPGALARMERISRAAPAGASWRETTSPGGYVRVLWSTKLDFPLEIESGSASGKKRDRVVVRIEPRPADDAMPWAHLAEFERKSDSDYMD
jgi:hypothetical protein